MYTGKHEPPETRIAADVFDAARTRGRSAEGDGERWSFDEDSAGTAGGGGMGCREEVDTAVMIVETVEVTSEETLKVSSEVMS